MSHRRVRLALPLVALALVVAGCASPQAELETAVADLTDAANARNSTEVLAQANEVITLAEQQRDRLGTEQADRIVMLAEAVAEQAERLQPVATPVPAPVQTTQAPEPTPEPVETEEPEPTPTPEPEPVETEEPEPTPEPVETEEPEPEPTEEPEPTAPAVTATSAGAAPLPTPTQVAPAAAAPTSPRATTVGQAEPAIATQGRA